MRYECWVWGGGCGRVVEVVNWLFSLVCCDGLLKGVWVVWLVGMGLVVGV